MQPTRKKAKPRGRPIQKGQVLNPLGGGAHDPKRREAKKLTRKAISEMAEEIIHGSVQSLQLILKDKTQSAIKMMMASMVLRNIQRGDATSFEQIMTQILGKEVDKLQISGDPMNPLAIQAVQVRIGLPSNGRNAPNDPSILITKEDDENG